MGARSLEHYNLLQLFCPSGVVVAVVAAHHHLPVAACGDDGDAMGYFVTISAKLVSTSTSRCVNEPGSYSCQCRRPGFVFFPDVGRCRRQDPCSGGGETETPPCGDRGR